MKRAKLMLTAIAVFAIVGGVVASKAKRGSRVYTTDILNAPATVTVNNATITPSNGAAAFATTIYSDPGLATLTTFKD